MPYMIFIASLIAPLYSLIFAMLETIKKRSGNLPNISIALAFASISFAVEPVKEYDIVRHYQRINSLKDLSYTSIIEQSSNGYYLFDSYGWLLNTLNLPKNLLPFTASFIAYLLILSIYTDIKTKYLQRSNLKIRALMFIAFWLSINFVALSSGIRHALAVTLMIYAVYKLYSYNNKVLFIVLSILSFLLHPFSLAIFILSFLSYKFKSYSTRGNILVYMAVIVFIGGNLTNYDLSLVTPILQKLNIYSESYFDAEGRSFNFLGKLFAIYIPSLAALIISSYLLTSKSLKNNPYYLLLCVVCLYLSFTVSYYTFYARMLDFYTGVFAIFITLEYIKNKSKRNKHFLIIFVLALITASLAAFILYFTNFISTARIVIYKPLLFMLFGI